MTTVFDKLDFWKGNDPDKLLYVFLDINGAHTEKYTYQEFEKETNRIASNLHHHFNLKKNDRVLLLFPPGLEMICSFFSCAKLGLIPVPVVPPSSKSLELSASKMAHIIEDCTPSAILTNSDYYGSFRSIIDTTPSLFSIRVSLSKLQWINIEDLKFNDYRDFKRDCSDVLFLQYTSGSTNVPKGVRVKHSNLLHNNEMIFDHESPIGVSWLPQYHDMGLIGYYLFIALHGGTTYGFSPSTFIQKPALWFETITKYRATAASAPNFAYEYCMQPGRISQDILNGIDLSSLKFLMTAAETVNVSTYKRFINFGKPYGLNPQAFFSAYGLAENTLVVSNYGRKIISLDRNSLALNNVKVVTEQQNAVSLVSCGRPLGDINVKIVEPHKHFILSNGSIGEIWINGQSKCDGYWNNSELTKNYFEASITGINISENKFIRTGDLGFIYDNELYISGRLKDMIIIRGLNYYPHDIEQEIEKISVNIRPGHTVAFSYEEGSEEKLVAVIGVKNSKTLPNANEIIMGINKVLGVKIRTIVFVYAKEIPKTSSGKTIRYKVRESWLDGNLRIIKQIETPNDSLSEEQFSAFDSLKQKYNLTGSETYSLGDALDSLDLAILMHDIQEALKGMGADSLSKKIDIGFIQAISISQLYTIVSQFNHSSSYAILELEKLLLRLQKEHKLIEQDRMINDSQFAFTKSNFAKTSICQDSNSIFLTGSTGFFGPFILKSLLEQTEERVYVLSRSANEIDGKYKLKKNIELLDGFSSSLQSQFDERVNIVCGDLGQSRLGLNMQKWDFLSKEIGTIYHNGAVVNYLFNYDKMRNVNVMGTNEIIRLALENNAKTLNYISTTFVFGWAVKNELFEDDLNENLGLLDFGYSQSKWVAEQLVVNAINKGLKARIFRPALITPSINGSGNNFDISIRLLSFMLNHKITVDANNQVSFTPADIAANNIVAISNLSETINRIFHVTRDNYANMKNITDIIAKQTGIEFETFSLKEFTPEVIKRCTKDDLLFPLLDFLVRSVDNISSMEFKRYNSSLQTSKKLFSVWSARPHP